VAKLRYKEKKKSMEKISLKTGKGGISQKKHGQAGGFGKPLLLNRAKDTSGRKKNDQGRGVLVRCLGPAPKLVANPRGGLRGLIINLGRSPGGAISIWKTNRGNKRTRGSKRKEKVERF